jgi:hypothetical protein
MDAQNDAPAAPDSSAATGATGAAATPPAGRYPAAYIGACLLVAACSLSFAAYRFLSPALNVTSEPAGASVFVNGRLAGATPVAVKGLGAGTYALRIEKAGFEAVAHTIDVPVTGARVHEHLQAAPTGSISVNVNPKGAEVLLDGEFMGSTPLFLPKVVAGVHELVVRKTNYKTYTEKLEIAAGDTLEYAGFALEDVILTMLKSQIEADRQRVTHYMDLGHYLFVNDRLEDAAEAYSRALEVAGTQLTFDDDVPKDERQLMMRLRAEDVNKLHEEIRKKSSWPGKDVKVFTEVMRKQQESVANGNVNDWIWVREQAENYRRDNRFEKMEQLYTRHIEAAKGTPNVSQAYIELMRLRVQTKNLQGLRDTKQEFYSQYKNQPMLLRQAANAIYTGTAGYDGEQQIEVLALAEHMLQKAVYEAQRAREQTELIALCKFELANVFLLEKKSDRAVPLYRESIDETNDGSTKELRSLKMIDALKDQKRYDDARAILGGLLKSPRASIVARAQGELNAIEKAEPSPDPATQPK